LILCHFYNGFLLAPSYSNYQIIAYIIVILSGKTRNGKLPEAQKSSVARPCPKMEQRLCLFQREQTEMSSASDFDLLNPISHLVLLLMASKDSLDPNSSLPGPGLCRDLV